MIATNKARLPRGSAVGKIKDMTVSPRYCTFMNGDGVGELHHGGGGINYDFQIGDNCMDIEGTVLSPGVSIEGPESHSLQVYGCLGNEVIVTSGEARGEKGCFTGKIFAGNHCHAYFPRAVLEKFSGDERFLVRCHGQGLRFLDYPQVEVMNLDPGLCDKLGIREEEGCLHVPVTHVVPAQLMGEGWGNLPYQGEIDLSTDDEASFEKFNLASLRFGDVVYVQDLDTTHGVCYLKGAATVGVIVHSNGRGMGFGPGVMTILSSKKPILKPVMDENANVGNYLGIMRKEEA